MAQRHSQQDQDGIVWNTASLPLGTRGLDMRRADDPGTLSELLNARFLDDRTVKRRDGHLGRLIQSGSGFSESPFRSTNTWVYGHGTRIINLSDEGIQDGYHPIHVRGGGTFHFDGTDVVWTGDRMFVVSAEGYFHGDDAAHWNADYLRGHEAYLPVLTDAVHPAGISGELQDVVVTPDYRIVAATNLADEVVSWVFDRTTNAIIEYTVHSAVASTQLRLVNSGGIPCLLWLESGTDLKLSSYEGRVWSTPSTVQASIDHFDTALTTAGFVVIWRDGALVKVGSYLRGTAQSTPFAFGASVDTSGTTPNAEVAVAVAPDGRIAAVWGSNNGAGHDKVYVRTFTSAMTLDRENSSGDALELTSVDDHTPFVIAAAYRGLRDEYRHELRVFGDMGTQTYCWTVLTNATAIFQGSANSRFNSRLLSKAFTIGHETFAWCSSENGNTSFLASGHNFSIVGVADREERIIPQYLPSVAIDPDDEHVAYWCRRRYMGAEWTADNAQTGNCRVGTLTFLNPLSTAKYGRSVYVAGSLVRNWDGYELGDAGFHDYPVVGTHATDTTGALTQTMLYEWRVYAVRYNAKGERFQSPAITYSVTLAGAQDKVNLYIDTMPLTNHENVVYEVYRTPGGGGAFRYEGKVAHSFTAAQVTFASTLSDAAIATNTADPFETGVAGDDLVEDFAPLGCAKLVASADRLWGIGGQVPPGYVQFSKLYTVNRGAGFNDIDAFHMMDVQGNELTSLANFNDATVVAFSLDRIYVLVGGGPDNYDNGSFGIPQVHEVDGALVHEGTTVAPIGICYWGTGGPRVLTDNLTVSNISEPVAQLANTMTPSGVRVDYARTEIVWYTEAGDAILFNWTNNRWARWDGLRIAGCSPTKLVTTNGRVLTQTEGVKHDDGRRYTFKIATGNVRPDQILAGNTLLRRFGMVGEAIGEHRARFRIFFDNSRLWYQQLRWVPASSTWLAPGTDFEDMTPAQIDALGAMDHSGSYSTHHRSKKQHCQFFRLEVSDLGNDGFIPWEFVFELGQTAGLARTPVNRFE